MASPARTWRRVSRPTRWGFGGAWLVKTGYFWDRFYRRILLLMLTSFELFCVYFFSLFNFLYCFFYVFCLFGGFVLFLSVLFHLFGFILFLYSLFLSWFCIIVVYSFFFTDFVSLFIILSKFCVACVYFDHVNITSNQRERKGIFCRSVLRGN